MDISNLNVAFNEFIYVSSSLVVIIAAVSIVTGLMREYIPQDKMQRQLIKHQKYGPALGAAFGTLTPFCSAAVVPVTMGMASMGASLGTVFSFLISAPLCNFVVLAMIFAVFGLEVTACYLVLTLSAAVIGGWLISLSPWKNEIKRGEELETKDNESDCSAKSSCSTPVVATAAAPDCASRVTCESPSTLAANPQPVGQSCAVQQSSCINPGPTAVLPDKLCRAMKFAWALFKRIMPYVLVGALISGLSAAYLPAEIVETYVGSDNLSAIIIAAVIGVPLYLRIEMAIPLIKILILKGMGMGPAMALIIGGTGASLPEIALVSSVLKPKAVIAFVLMIITTAIIGGLLFQMLF
ncbi:permease [Shewanella sp. Scap07]|uniref:permease n=1 Tax=Shewanella sp. Scap07 TaxID=2589987 RepID=UPI0015BCD710|nr:permease [Shewanella sp. Scap07]QLE86513.1 permease [Shewanella sp. Scap07]